MHPIVTGGIAVGVLDILAAFAVRYAFMKASPLRVLQGIASGVMGPGAFGGGLGTALVGLALHFVIAFAVSAVYFVGSRRLRFLGTHPVWAGTGYGVAVHAVMNYTVLPLSRFPAGTRTPPVSFTATMIAVHVFFVGLPVAVAVSRWDRAANTSRSGLSV